MLGVNGSSYICFRQCGILKDLPPGWVVFPSPTHRRTCSTCPGLCHRSLTPSPSARYPGRNEPESPSAEIQTTDESTHKPQVY